jgi:hypothetical protein
MSALAVEADLDWNEFSAEHFPRSRRHDMQALVAYGAYKRSRGRREAPGEPLERAETGAADRAALETWEGEGGHPS